MISNSKEICIHKDGPESEKKQFYHHLYKQVVCLCDNEANWLSTISNVSSLLYHELNGFSKKQKSPSSDVVDTGIPIQEIINWVGFYFYNEDQLQLHLGPFQGKMACTRIPFGKGVCGVAIKERMPQVVSNVHSFHGHIACNSQSQSEIVIPLICPNTKKILGVLDLDSIDIGQFDEEDKNGLVAIANLLDKSLTIWVKSYPNSWVEPQVNNKL